MTGNTEKLTQSHQTPGQNEQAESVQHVICGYPARALCAWDLVKRKIGLSHVYCFVNFLISFFAFLMALNFALMALINPSPKSSDCASE